MTFFQVKNGLCKGIVGKITSDYDLFFSEKIKIFLSCSKLLHFDVKLQTFFVLLFLDNYALVNHSHKTCIKQNRVDVDFMLTWCST